MKGSAAVPNAAAGTAATVAGGSARVKAPPLPASTSVVSVARVCCNSACTAAASAASQRISVSSGSRRSSTMGIERSVK